MDDHHENCNAPNGDTCVCGLLAQIEVIIQERDDLRRQLTEAQKQSDEWLSTLGKRLDQAQSDNAALLGALRKVAYYFDIDSNVLLSAAIRDELTKPHPGAALLEEVAALRKVVGAIEGHDDRYLREKVTMLKQSDGEGWAVGEMLERAIDAIRNREGRHA